ncbi:hypothetical protein HXX76_007847 [Chlamydomonas incerta]|uniref:Uncharacterized protein n=1 Tax=Chlamydomonas incerta TaxID=51695 RepID=A0A835T9Q9_CHLIN|nr:hypothetical protein HXX76_007847 [Chlamydomonas incerta]|eukprot:KAG2434120.1 hypothetical protein HXX76_007847 [Chlamydomonas incerta]
MHAQAEGDPLLGQRVAIPASEWGQSGYYWGTIVQEGVDTSGAQCVGVSVDAGRTFFWPRQLVAGWLVETANLSQPGRSPKRARVDPPSLNQQQQQQHHHHQQPAEEEEERRLGGASACDGAQLSADEQQPQPGPKEQQGQSQRQQALPAGADAARDSGGGTPPPAANTGPGGSTTGVGHAAQLTTVELPEGAMLLARCPARRSPSSSPGSKRGAGPLPAGATYIERCPARRSPSCSPPGARGRAGADGSRGAFEGGSPPPPLRGLGNGQQRHAAGAGTRAAGAGSRGSGGGAAAAAAGAAPSGSGRLGPGATYLGTNRSSGDTGGSGSGGGGGGGGGSAGGLPPRAPLSGNLHGLMLQARGKHPLAQIQNHPASAGLQGGASKVLPLGNAGAGAGGGAPLADLVGALFAHSKRAATARRAGAVQEAEEAAVPRNGLEAAAAGIPLGRAIY